MGKIIQARWKLQLALSKLNRPHYQVAKELGMGAPLLSNILNGRVNPNDQEMAAFEKLLGIPRHKLFPHQFIDVESV